MGTICYIGVPNKSRKEKDLFNINEPRRNLMARKSVSVPMFPSLIILLFLMIAGKMPIAASTGMSGETSGSKDAKDEAGKSTGANPLPAIRYQSLSLSSKISKRVDPVYPELAKRARVSGIVKLILSIDEEGNVIDVRLQSGHPFLNDAAINAAKQWKYVPILLSAEPVPVVETVAVIFDLDRNAAAASGNSRIDLAVADAIMRHKAGQSISDMPFIREEKANLELMVANKTANITSKLKSSGFNIIAWSEGSKKVIGSIAIEKLELLLNIDAVKYIAPHLS
jgi:TonB family protein